MIINYSRARYESERLDNQWQNIIKALSQKIVRYIQVFWLRQYEDIDKNEIETKSTFCEVPYTREQIH